ncbi:MAG: T9SS type A sorting domain-containing protein [Candidatus Cloacimonas sp.]|jgi:hypothetical protein|nr:T9SS type A sorting domain-containing protein [Candidatus Cloacimonas sp.]
MKTLLKMLALALLLLSASCTLFTAAENADPQNNHDVSIYWLGDASPNPVSVGESVTFEYYTKDGKDVSILITNVLEQEVRTLSTVGGSALVWNGLDKHGRVCGSGVYFYRMSSGAYNSMNKMLLIK